MCYVHDLLKRCQYTCTASYSCIAIERRAAARALSRVADATQRLFNGGLPALTPAMEIIDAPSSAEACLENAECHARISRTLSSADSQLVSFTELQDDVRSLQPYVEWYGVCGSEAAHR